jgi:glyoxylase-like metal-dependent hydrolase (beta-lactamase superfamily II)
MPAHVQSFLHPDSNTFSYVVHDPATRNAALIDAALDYDAESGALSDAALQPLLGHVRDNALEVRWLLETHAHADHVSAGRMLKRGAGHLRAAACAGPVGDPGRLRPSVRRR